MAASLSVSIVTYAPDLHLLGRVVRSVAESVDTALGRGTLAAAELTLVDNGPGEKWAPLLRRVAEEHWTVSGGRSRPVTLLTGHGNVGYGRGHNRAIVGSTADWHLVLNPDALLERDTLDVLLRALHADPGVTLAAPRFVDEKGEPLYLCKRYPSVLDLSLRGFAPAVVRRWCAARLARYEMQDVIGNAPYRDVPIFSGCFMLARTSALQQAGGFSPAFFMYFEDFDLSLRLGRVGTTLYVPTARVTHLGGHAARKGWRHIIWFSQSAVRFFRRHGWKLW